MVISPGEEDEDSEVEDDDEVEEESEGFSAGDVVWGRVRSWWPGQVIDVSEIPDLQSRHLGELPSNCVFFQRFIKEDIRILPASRVQELGENKVDFLRAAVSEEIQSAWEFAVLKMRGDL